MSSVQFLRLFAAPLSKMSIMTSVSMIFLLVGLQAIMDVKFSCPCRVERNHALISCILFAPAIFALVIMLLLWRLKYKSRFCSSQEQNNSGTSPGKDSSGTSQGKDSSGPSQGKDSSGKYQGKDNSGTSQGKDSSGKYQGKDNSGPSQGKDKSGTSQGKDNSGTSQGKDISGTSQGKDNSGTSQGKDSSGTSQCEKKCGRLKEFVENLRKAFVVCIPCLVWICIFFINGDYLACGFTNWNGHYACDKELHPRCVNWCKPTKLSPGKNETECYERTLELIWISKITGYGLAVIFCIIAVIFVICCDCCKSQESQEQQSPGTTGQHESGSSQAGEGRKESGGSATTKKGEQGPESSDTMEMKNLLSDHQHKDSC